MGRTGNESGKEASDHSTADVADCFLAPAHRRLQEAVNEVAAAWNGLAPGVRPWLAPAIEERLDAAITARFRARDLPGALAAVETWQATWLDLLVPARRLAAERLFELALDPALPPEDRAAYAAEVHRRAWAMTEEGLPDGKAHPRIEGAPLGPCRYPGHRCWRPIHGVVVCGVCHPPAHPDLVAEWVPPLDPEGGEE